MTHERDQATAPEDVDGVNVRVAPVQAGGVELRADCERCFGLCCVAPAFAASADFAIDKDAGQACPHLHADFRCGIHARLRPLGFPGCTVYDCFGAGQKVAQVTFGGQDWRHAPHLAQRMFEAFRVMRQLHELLWYLSQALTLPPARRLAGQLGLAFDETLRLSQLEPEALLGLDVDAHRGDVNVVLRQASELARAGVSGPKADRSGEDLTGATLRGADLRGASFRGSRLLGADLSGADLRVADFTGADLRGADVSRADLRGSIFFTQSQLDAARGDADTRLPPSLHHPTHWPRWPGARLRNRPDDDGPHGAGDGHAVVARNLIDLDAGRASL